MTWHETHLRWQALRDIEALADQDPTGTLPWNQEYAALFGTREQLLAALRYRWNLAREAQLDSHLDEDELEAARRDLSARQAGVLRILTRYVARREEDLGRAS